MRANASYDFLLTTWEGGGSVPPVLTVARRLIAAGHRVRIMSDRASRAEVLAAGAEFIAWRRAPSRASKTEPTEALRDWDVPPVEGFTRLIHGVLIGPALEYTRDLIDELDRRPADLVVSSEMLFGVMAGCEARRQPLALLSANLCLYPVPGMPPFGAGLMPATTDEDRRLHAQIAAGGAAMFNAGLPALNRARTALGLMPLDNVFDQLGAASRILLGTSQAFDFPVAMPESHRYLGPQLDELSWAEPWVSPWGDGDERPLALVSFSTTFQNQAGALQRVVDAVAGLPMRAVVTLGPNIAPSAVRSGSENVHVCRSAPHGSILRQASLAVTHGGHGTLMRALAHRLPVLVMPMGRDQNDNAARVSYHGAGLSLSPDSSTDEIGAALHRLLSEPAFTAAARRLGDEVRRDAESCVVVSELLETAILARLDRLAGQARAA
jgi:MGT family glycosyltransferase